MDASTSHDAISQFLDEYVRKFNDGDFDSAASCYHEPAAVFSVSGVTIFSKRSEIAEMFKKTVQRLREDGWDHSEWAGSKKIVTLDDSGLVLASCPCKRLRKDGTSCEEFTATYTLRKKDQNWFVAAIHQHPLGSGL